MKLYQLAKMSEPRFVMTSPSIYAIRDLLSKYIPMKEQTLALQVPNEIDIDNYTARDDVSLLLCTETGCDFLMEELEFDERMFI